MAKITHGGAGVRRLLIAAALGLVACGGEPSKTVVETVTTTTKAPSTAPKTEAREPSTTAAREANTCKDKGIDAQQRNEGTCEANGLTVTVANRDTPLRLEELTATLTDIEIRATIEGEYDTVRARGKFVILRLSVTNRLDAPEAFASQQAVLQIENKTYTQSSDGDLTAVEDAWTSQYEELQPGETRQGALIFDLPAAAAAKAESRAATPNLLLVNFSAVGEENPKRFGLFRLSR